ncbi:MAG: sugar kinase [Alphaproteobacteria bacterium]|nr:sugar kinase [Alphaproteobacteria bacterium]
MAQTIQRIAAIGECMIELQELGPGHLHQTFGGDTLNTSVYLARLLEDRGVQVDYATALGDDPFSDQMLAGWRAEGVGTDLVARLPGRLPGLYWIKIDAHGERTFYYWRRQAAARELFTASEARALTDRLAGYDLIYVSGISLSILPDAGRKRLIDILGRVRAAGARVAFDSNYRPRNWSGVEETRRWYALVLDQTDIALPTFDDEASLYGDRDPEETAERVHEFGVAEVVVKCDRDPCVVSWPDGRTRVPAETVARVVDTTAAGDSFNAGYLAARVIGKAPDAAAQSGHALAAEVVQHKGAIAPQDAMPEVL